MDRTTFDRLVEQHAWFPHVIRDLVRDTEDALLRSRESEGRWSPLEILAHLADEEVEDFRPRARAAAEQLSIDWKLDPQAWVVERRYNEMDPARVLRDFEAERQSSCRWLRELDLELLDQALEHPRFGPLRCGDFIAAWRVHDLLHLRQLSTALVVLGARTLSGWKVDYAGDIPRP